MLFTAALYSVLRLPPIPPRRTLGPARAAVGASTGCTSSPTRPVLTMSFGVDILAMVLAMPRSLFPAVAAERFHGDVGPLYAAIAIGSLLAGVSSGWIGRVRRQGVALTGAVVAWGICVAASGLAHQLWLVVVLLAFAGAADLVSAVYRQTILQTYAPDEMRGRMQGVFIAVVAGGPRLGDVRAGATAAATGVDVLVGGRRGRVRGRGAIAGSPCARSGVTTASVAAAGEVAAAVGDVACRRRTAVASRMALTRCAVSSCVAGEFAATIVEVGAGLRRFTFRGVDVTVPYGETCCRPRARGGGARAVAEPAARRALLLRRPRPTSSPLTEPAQRNAIHGLARWVRWTPLRDRAGLGDAGDRPGAADRLAVRGAGRGHLHACTPSSG